MEKILVSFLVVHYNQPALLKACLKSISKYANFKHEVLVVNNSLSCDLSSLKEKFGFRLLIPHKNLGFGAGNNFAAKYAQGQYFCILNPDTELTSTSFKNLLRLFARNRKLGLVGPALQLPDKSTQDSVRNFPSLTDLFLNRLSLGSRYILDIKTISRPCPVPWVVGAVLILPRRVYKKLSGFDERFFLFLEDTDLCRRVWQMGLEVYYSPQNTFQHSEKRLSRQGIFCGLFKKSFWFHFSSVLKYFFKYFFSSTLSFPLSRTL